MEQIPRGVWAIGSELAGVAETQSFLQTAALSAAVTLRRPSGGAKIALYSAKSLVQNASFVAVHGHADLALAAGAHAVIAGFRSLPISVYRAKFPGLLLGASTHTQQEIELALHQGADFLIFGPIWSTPKKNGILEPRGIEQLRLACSHQVPVIAIGGISHQAQAEACIQVGAHGVAVLRAAKSAAQMQDLVGAFA
ncbi:MAG: thiamine phosphate synthase [Planctomycetota bacterium]